MSKVRGFEVVRENARTAFETFTGENKQKVTFPIDIKLPTRGSAKSAGYDFYNPKKIQILPGQKTIIFTDVKAYMPEGWVLKIYIRSSLAIKKGIMLSNNVGIVDCDYYGNEGNDGNIGIPLVNTSGTAVTLDAGERIAQGIFEQFGTIDEDVIQTEIRKGGFGSSGK